MSFLSRFWYLLMAHAFTDYIWQTSEMGRYKHPWADIPLQAGPWWWHMVAHGLINAAGVSIVTGSTLLGLAEFGVHCTLDYLKCLNYISTWADQGGHLISKGIWAYLCLFLPP